MNAHGRARLFYGILVKDLVLLVRYPVNTFGQLVSIFALFLVLFLGGRAAAPQALNDTLAGIIVGFFLFIMTIRTFMNTANTILEESQWGTLEQLHMSPFGLGQVMVFTSLSTILLNFVWGSLSLAFMMLITGERLAINVFGVVPIVFASLAMVAGLGFVMGGLAIVYKRVSAMIQLLRFPLIALIAAPVESIEAAKYLPLAFGSYLLRRSMTENLAVWELPAADVGLLVVQAVAYFALGFGVFQYASHVARKRGVMGHY